MKVSVPKNNNGSQKKAPRILPLILDKDDTLAKEDSIAFNLRTTTTSANSPTYKFTMRILKGTEDARTVIKWRTDIQKVITGLNITAHAPMKNTIESALSGNALNAFDDALTYCLEEAKKQAMEDAADDAAKAVEEAKDITDWLDVDQVKLANDMMVGELLPYNALRRAKQELRRDTRKPVDMGVKTYYSNINRINSKELPNLPPFSAGNSLLDDEIVDIIIYGCPKKWTREAERQGKDLESMTSPQVVRFFEQIEASEDFDPNVATGNNKKSGGSGGSGGSSKAKKVTYGKNGQSSGGGDKTCMLHGKGGHTTEECKTLKKEATKLKESYNGNSNNTNGSKHKTWSRKKDDKDVTKKDINSYIKKKVAKELATVDKKRKLNESESDSESSLDMAAIEKELKDFNYDDIDLDEDFTEMEI